MERSTDVYDDDDDAVMESDFAFRCFYNAVAKQKGNWLSWKVVKLFREEYYSGNKGSQKQP